MVCVCEGRGVQRRQLRGTLSPSFHWIWILLIGPTIFHQQSMFCLKEKFSKMATKESREQISTQKYVACYSEQFWFFTSTSPTQWSHHFIEGQKTKQSSSGLPKTHFWTKIFHIWSAFSLYPDMGAMGTLWTKKPKLSHLRHIMFTNFWYVMTFSLCLHMGSLGIKIRITQS